MASIAQSQTTSNPMYDLRSTGKKRKMSQTGSLENKRYKDGVSSGTGSYYKAGSITNPPRVRSSKRRDDHQNKRSGSLGESSASRQVPAGTPQAPSNEVMITDGTQAELADQQSSKTRQPKQETDITIAYPYIDEIVFFRDPFAFCNPSSVLVQKVWENVSNSIKPCHIPEDSIALRRQMKHRAAEKTRELANKADKVILSVYGLEEDWKRFNGSRQYNDQLQDLNKAEEAARKEFSNKVEDLLDNDKLLHPNITNDRFGAPQIVEIIWKLWLSTDICRGHQIVNFIDRINAPFIWLHCSLLYLALYQYHRGNWKKLPINKGWGKDIYTRQKSSWKWLDDGEQKKILEGIRSILRNRRNSGGSVDPEIGKILEPRSTECIFSKIQPSTNGASLISNKYLSQDRASPIEGRGGDMA